MTRRGEMQSMMFNRRREWAALLAVIAVGVGTPTLIDLINALAAGRGAAGDFIAWVRQAAIAFNHGLSPYLSDSAETARIGTYPSFYPPFNLLLFWPFTVLSDSAAMLIQWLANASCLVGLLYLLTLRFKPIAESPRIAAVVLVCACLSTGISNTFQEGQVNIELALLLTLALIWSVERKRDAAMGALLALAALLKFYFILLLPLLLLRRRRKALLAAGTVLGVALLVTLLFFPWRGWGDWLEFVRSSGFGQAPHGWKLHLYSSNQSLNGYLSVLFGDGKITQVLGILLGAGVVMVTALSVWMHRNVPDELFWPRALGGTVMATFLIAPLSWMHYFVIHLAVAAWLWSMAKSAGARRLAAFSVGLMVYSSLPWNDALSQSAEAVVRWLPMWGTVGLWFLALMPCNPAPAAETIPQSRPPYKEHRAKRKKR